MPQLFYKEELMRVSKKSDFDQLELAKSPSAAYMTKQDSQNIVSLTYTLKKQLSELSSELKEKEEEITKVKRNVKLTKIQELEVELKGYQDETVRLKGMLEKYLRVSSSNPDKSLQEKFMLQLK
jgi:hypothetical protein